MISTIKNKFNNVEFLKYFKNTSWLMIEQILRMMVGLFVGIWVARYLGPNQFGIFNYALAFTTLFSGMIKLGLDSIVIRELVKFPEKRDEIFERNSSWKRRRRRV